MIYDHPVAKACGRTAEGTHHENCSTPRCRTPMGFRQPYGCHAATVSRALLLLLLSCYGSTQIHSSIPCWHMVQQKRASIQSPKASKNILQWKLIWPEVVSEERVFYLPR
ncbi:hypothetical protein GUJ93_ZPchr0007g4187 [Zizania palustris]|uniref:Uncharacterized protein n=1 Tax=Zizania palustris TaxID=103762 RepID=A0A8J5W546_ZIZPA|nr:hypothetical protein GUJ93_ZPchr0007g4187 [Zizania palustris]